MSVYLKWAIYVKEIRIWSFLDWEKPENVCLACVDERQQLPECTWFAALGGHAYLDRFIQYKQLIQHTQIYII